MIIGIGGVSRAGKSTLAEKLKKYFEKSRKSVHIFCQDDFVKPVISLAMVEGVPDWERPSTIKWDNLMSAMERSKADVKIVEGLFAFYAASIRSEYDKKIFVELERTTFESRKSKDKRWAEEPEWYANHVWKSYLKYGQRKGPEEEYITVSGEVDFNIKKVVTDLEL
ncbi:MAG: hypothetical protein RIA69_09225 [Cyclobacteriaceae bacterium]